MSAENFFKKFITGIAQEVVNTQRNLQTSKPNTGMAKVIDFNTETGELTLELDNGTKVDGIKPGASPVGPGSYGILAGGAKFIN